MSIPDFNLLLTLDAVLTEGSVVRAAKRLHLSPSAMSRALARLRETTGDPLLVRAGRGLVPTPRALALREHVRTLVEQSMVVLRPAEELDLTTLVRTFTLRSRDGFAETFGPQLIDRIAHEAPGVRLRFLQKADKEATSLRDGSVELETGVIDQSTAPEMLTRPLFRDRFIGVIRVDHPLSHKKMNVERYAQGRHVGLTMNADGKSAIDEQLALMGLKRNIVVTVGGFSTALMLARDADLIASVPERHTARLREAMISFALPVATPELEISLLWHPRMDADPAHRWLRALVFEVCNRPT